MSDWPTVPSSGSFAGELLPNETIEWTGKPVRRRFAGLKPVRDLGLMVAGGWMLWRGLPLLIDAVRHYKPGAGNVGIYVMSFFCIFGLILFVPGPISLIRSILGSTVPKDRVHYALTNRRALVLCTLQGRALDSYDLTHIGTIGRRPNRDGTGDIVFGRTGPRGAGKPDLRRNPRRRSGAGRPGFYEIGDVHSVYELAVALQRQALQAQEESQSEGKNAV